MKSEQTVLKRKGEKCPEKAAWNAEISFSPQAEGNLPGGSPQPKPEAQEAQVQDFKRVMGKIDEDVRLVCLCGNHDVGDRPNAATLRRYTGRFGTAPAPLCHPALEL